MGMWHMGVDGRDEGWRRGEAGVIVYRDTPLFAGSQQLLARRKRAYNREEGRGIVFGGDGGGGRGRVERAATGMQLPLVV